MAAVPAGDFARELADTIQCDVTEADGHFRVGNFFLIKPPTTSRHITILCIEGSPPRRMTRQEARRYALLLKPISTNWGGNRRK